MIAPENSHFTPHYTVEGRLRNSPNVKPSAGSVRAFWKFGVFPSAFGQAVNGSKSKYPA